MLNFLTLYLDSYEELGYVLVKLGSKVFLTKPTESGIKASSVDDDEVFYCGLSDLADFYSEKRLMVLHKEAARILYGCEKTEGIRRDRRRNRRDS